MAQGADIPLRVYRVHDSPNAQADIVFVHGLTGSAAKTWSHAPGDTAAFWPTWLAPFGSVWVVDYPADLFSWWSSGAGMGIPERARSVMDLMTNFKIGQRPVVFIAHSLGGLLVKAMLRAASDLANPKWKALLRQTRGVVFLGTPHTGAALGSIANLLRVTGLSINATQLSSNEVHLRDLADWYSKNAKRLGIRSLAYYEKGLVKGVRVVDEVSADPRVDDCDPVASDENHIDICKPRAATDPVYMGIVDFLENVLGKQRHAAPENPAAPLDLNADTVFGMHRGDTYHYVQRTRVDDAFVGHLVSGKHLCIYGSSKQGKTALRKKHISPSQAVVVVCQRGWTCNDIFVGILKAAGCEIQRDSDGAAASTVSVHVPKTGGVLRLDLGHTADFLKALEQAFAGKFLVIEEFHYLPEETQRDLAFTLKAIHELSEHFVFIVIGVWLEKNRLVHLNKDLAGRVAPINADEWSDADLLRVVHEGEKRLNTAFPPGFADKLVQRACGSVYLVREACHRALEISNVYKRSDEFTPIEQSLNATAILKEIAKAGVDYPDQVIGLLGLDDIPLNEREREEGLRDWVLRMLVCSGVKDLQKGITVSKIRGFIRQKHPKGYHPTESQIERVIRAVQSAQLARNQQNLFDYDRQERIVRCVDKGFLLWRSGLSQEKIEHLIFAGELPSD